MTVCAVDGCERTDIAAKGLCWTHYQRMRLTGSFFSQRADDPLCKRVCAVEGCERRANGARGWCRSHYWRWRKYGDPLEPNRRGDGTQSNRRCDMEGCDRLAVSRGLCSMHTKRRERGLPLDAGNLGNREYRRTTAGCSVDGCDRLVYARGLCRLHYSREGYAKRRERHAAELHSIRS